MKAERIDVVMDLQFGSTGKGLLVGWLAKRVKYDTVVTTWAPNAGHTYIDALGRKFVHTQLALGIVSPICQTVLLGPGSVIDPYKLMDEIRQCSDIIESRDIRIAIHPHAAVVLDRHRQEEGAQPGQIGSTRKGVGAAIIDRIRRRVEDPNVASHCPDLSYYVVTADEYARLVERSHSMLIEGAQGYSLSMYHGFYPYTTSRDVSTMQILADAGIPMEKVWRSKEANLFNVYGTCRTYPIRVANRYDAAGKMTEFSGPGYNDQREISFEEIGQPQEYTTVTQLPRRIFTFSGDQIREAIRYNGVTRVFLNFVNYVKKPSVLVDILNTIESAGNARLHSIGLGPTDLDVVEIDGHQYTPYSSEQRVGKALDRWETYRA